VSYSPAFKWGIALLLALTLAWKFAGRGAEDGHPERRVFEFLIHHGFDVALTENVRGDIIIATSAACQVRIAKASYDGDNRDLIRSLATESDRIFYVFQGRQYLEQPVWLTVSNRLWTRFLSELGFERAEEPILAVIASQQCDAERLPWVELQFAEE
jgi:hypothetical protein